MSYYSSVDYFFHLLRKGEFFIEYDTEYNDKWTNEELSNHITILTCSGNQLTILPELPYVIILYCYGNQLISLPKLPNVRVLDCHNNQLTTLPELPNVIELYNENN